MNKDDEFDGLIQNYKVNHQEDPPKRRPEPRSGMYGAGSHREDAPPARKGGGKNEFQVRIDETQYKTGGPPKKPPQGRDPRDDNDEDDEEEQESALKGVNRWIKALIALALALGVSVFLAVFALASASDLFGLNKEDKPIVFELPENLSLSETASLLKKNNVITQPLTFQLYVSLKKDQDFIPGTYELNSNMSYDQIMVKFRTGSRQRIEVKLLFPEGVTLREIAAKLEENEVCTAQAFYDFLDQDEMAWDLDFLKQIPDSETRFRRYEGYLFPDTYMFEKGEDISTVVQKFFYNFNNRIDEDLRKRIEAKGMTVDEVITMASMLEKEAGNEKDMKLIASVFQNRLARPQEIQGLQSDVTVFYVEDNIKPFLGGEPGKSIPNDPNQPIYDAYNTYKCAGLPVGPICNPGLKSIEAVLDPTPSEYLYFVADKDGVTYYAKSFEEHKANVAAAEAKGDAHGIGTGIGIEEDLKE